MTTRPTSLLALFLVLLAAPAFAAVAVIAPSKDNTLYENATGAVSNGVGPTSFAGRTAQASGSLRRGLIAFGLGSIPAGSTITSARLDLHVSMVGNASPRPIALHRATADWGEGTSNAGTPGATGAPSTANDATWIHRFFPGLLWTSGGGDFTAAASATQNVTGVGSYSWGSTPAMVSDVQAWLTNPAANFGWLLRGDESVGGSAVRYDSRECPNTTFRPSLTVEYDPPATPTHSTSWGRIKALFR